VQVSEIVKLVKPYHGLHLPEVELPAILRAFGDTPARSFLEIGTYQGGTSAAVALAFPDAKICTIEVPDPSRSICNAQPISKVGRAFFVLCPGRVEQLWMDSADLGLLSPECSFDMIFVDGDHTASTVLRDLRLSVPLLTKQGVILVHDYTDETDPEPRAHWTKWVHQAVAAFTKNHRFNVKRLAGWLALLQRPERP